jgi:hypothetical protein
MTKGASAKADRATHERSQSSVSPPSVGVPSAAHYSELVALIDAIRKLAEDPSDDDAYLGRCCWDDAAVHRNWDRCRQRLEDIRNELLNYDLFVDANASYSETQLAEIGGGA